MERKSVVTRLVLAFWGSAVNVLKSVTISHRRPGYFISGPRLKSIKVLAASIIFVTLVKTSLLAIQKLGD